MSKKIIACGCSFTHGFYHEFKNDELIPKINKNYIQFLEESIGNNILNLSDPGVSNYCIIKQVEYAVSLKPDLIIFNTTLTNRIDIAEKRLKHQPTFQDFISNLGQSEGSIRSITFLTLQRFIKKGEFYKKLFGYYVEYVNEYISEDQQKLMIWGIIKKLDDLKIKYLILDFANLLSSVNRPEIIKKFNHKDMKNKYPNNDTDSHWNEQGHQEIAYYLNTTFDHFRNDFMQPRINM